MSSWWRDSKNIEEIEFSRWLFEGWLRQGKNVLPDGLNWLCYFAGSSKSCRENSMSFIFLESTHQVDMKHVVKSSKHFFGYFKTLETHSEIMWCLLHSLNCRDNPRPNLPCSHNSLRLRLNAKALRKDAKSLKTTKPPSVFKSCSKFFDFKFKKSPKIVVTLKL